MQTARSSSRSSKNRAPRPHGTPVSIPSERGRIQIGRILRAHGVAGALIMQIDASLRELAGNGRCISLVGPSDTLEVTIASSASHKSGLRIRVGEISDRATADAWASAAVFIDHDALPEPGADEYYDFEIMGAIVDTVDGECLGTVTEIIDTGAGDVFVVTGSHGEVLVPVTRAAVIEIDREQRRIVVEPDALEYSGSSRTCT